MQVRIEIENAAHGGCGVGRVEGRVWFVPYAIPGDTVSVVLDRETRGIRWGRLCEVIEPSPHRIAPGCPVFGHCGGCGWLQFAYPAQTDWKRRIIHDCFARIAGIEVEPEWRENAGLRLGYRTRAEFHGSGGNWGFFAPATHSVVAIESCPLCHPRLNSALATLRRARHEGTVEITVNPEGEETLVWSRHVSSSLAAAFPEAEGPYTRAGRGSFLFDGAPIVNGAFSQSSLLLNRLLVETVAHMTASARNVLDLYCGNGNLSRQLAETARVLGFDHNSTSIDAANGASRGEYRVGDETAFADALDAESWDAVILDPPRTGAKRLAPALAACGAALIVYVSCDPATLARDVKMLVAAGWHVDTVTGLDLFPHTAHVETVCCLRR